jgi:hypothetical protein
MWSRVVATASVAVLSTSALVACNGTDPSTPAKAPAAAQATERPSGGPGAAEVRASSDAMETWALMYRPSPWRTGEQVKVVWKSTGTGEVRIFAVSPGGREVLPVTGPTPHSGSNWDRPGDEWGTFFELDEPGAWTSRLERGQAAASLPVTATL